MLVGLVRVFCLLAVVGQSSAQQSDPMIREVDDDIVRRLTPSIEIQFSEGIKPMGYDAHHFVEIDVDRLRNELRQSLRAYDQANQLT